jgi:hypothetical protein
MACYLWCSIWRKLQAFAQSITSNPEQDEDKHQMADGCKDTQWDLLGRTFCCDSRFSITLPIPYPSWHWSWQPVDLFDDQEI